MPLRALSPTLSVFTMLALLISFLGVSRMSPVGTVAVHLSGRLADRLARAPRVDLVGRAPRLDGLVAFLAAFALWVFPVFAGAYAVNNPGPIATVIAVVALALTTVVVGALAVGRDRDVVTLGADGLRTAMWGFVPYGATTGTEVDGDDLRVRREVHARVAAIPAEELLGTLRDGSIPREERVRVAEVLRNAAPAEIRRLAEETADDDLRELLIR